MLFTAPPSKEHPKTGTRWRLEETDVGRRPFTLPGRLEETIMVSAGAIRSRFLDGLPGAVRTGSGTPPGVVGGVVSGLGVHSDVNIGPLAGA